MMSQTKTRFRQRKRRVENQKTCSFFDVEKQVSKTKNELSSYIAVTTEDHFSLSSSTYNLPMMSKKVVLKAQQMESLQFIIAIAC